MHELEVVRVLDPLGLFEQVKQLQRVFLLTPAVSPFSSSLNPQVPTLCGVSGRAKSPGASKP
jgi:hypothetical protein